MESLEQIEGVWPDPEFTSGPVLRCHAARKKPVDQLSDLELATLLNQDIGVNLYVRQPLPISGMPWRMEASAELRNLLAQGYLPLGGAGTHSVLTNSPRSLRGGLNFIF